MDMVLGYQVDHRTRTVRHFGVHEDHVDQIWSMTLADFLSQGEMLLDTLLAALKRAELAQELINEGLSTEEIDRQLQLVLHDDA